MRYAIFYTPAADDPLTHAAAGWLGHDLFGRDTSAFQRNAEIDEGERRALVEKPSRYGFHATLKAPFDISDGFHEAALLEAFDRLVEAAAPVYIGPLDVAREEDGSFALRPRARSHGLGEFAFRVVKWFEPFRSLPSADELARRRKAGLTARQDALLIRWGYPYVGEEYRFHMVLTGPVADADAPRIARGLERAFGPLAEDNTLLDTITLVAEPAPGAPFVALRQAELGVAAEPRRLEA